MLHGDMETTAHSAQVCLESSDFTPAQLAVDSALKNVVMSDSDNDEEEWLSSPAAVSSTARLPHISGVNLIRDAYKGKGSSILAYSSCLYKAASSSSDLIGTLSKEFDPKMQSLLLENAVVATTAAPASTFRQRS